MIKAILFDMDGVLVDAKDWHYEALNRALRLFGMEIERQSHLATFDGLPTRRKLEVLAQTRGFPRKLQSFVNDLKQSYTNEIIHSECRPVFHHRLALSRLKRDGYRLAVCSNSIRNSVALMMKLAGLDGYFDLLMSNEDVARPKPDPEIYTTAMTQLGVLPVETLILEDNEHGIQAARASGGHVHIVGSPDDVTYDQVCKAISHFEGKQKSS